jgi:hypothetical protein
VRSKLTSEHQCCVHHLIRVIRRCVSYHRDVVTKLSGIANSRFDARVRNQAYDNELMDSMLLEPDQIGVGEAAGAPMLLDDDFPGFGVNSARNSPPQVPYAKIFGAQAAFLSGRNVFPSLIVSRTVSIKIDWNEIMTDSHGATLPAFTEHRVQHAGGSLYVRDFPGSEPAFVLLHGFPDNSHIYDDLIPHLAAAGRRTIAFDFLGFALAPQTNRRMLSTPSNSSSATWKRSRTPWGLRRSSLSATTPAARLLSTLP